MKIRNKLLQYPKIISLFLGIISVAAFPPYYIFPLAIFSISGLYYILCQTTLSKQAFTIGYWFGFGHFAIGLSWIANALLVDFSTYGWLYPLCILALGLFFGIFIGLPALFIPKFSTPISKLLSFACLWTISEWLRSFILTGFPWNLFGSILTFRPELYQSSSIFGTYGLSLFTILFCAAPVLLFNKNNNNKIIALLILLLLPLGNYTYGAIRIAHHQEQIKANGLKIKLVQPSITQELKWNKSALENNFAKYIELSQQGETNSNFIIWGETATPFALDRDKQHRQQILKAIPNDGYLITGQVRFDILPDNKVIPYNSMLTFNKQGEIVATYDKSHLVPFGEYIPLRKYLPTWIKPITNTITDFQSGTGPQNIQLQNIPVFGVLICYEIIFPSQITNKKDRPQWLINLTNDAWYGDSAGPHQHLVTTILRATEEGLSIIRVANNGISANIDALGRIIAQLPLNYSGILDTQIPTKSSITTPYGQYGNIIPLTLIFTLFFIAILLSHRHNQKI